jgi:hypothetical protein
MSKALNKGVSDHERCTNWSCALNVQKPHQRAKRKDLPSYLLKCDLKDNGKQLKCQFVGIGARGT